LVRQIQDMTPAQARRLRAYQARLRQLASELASTGFISSGSVVQRSVTCGKPGCRCQADPPQLHGPYWQWSRLVNGKTVTRRLSPGQARLYQQWIANRRRLTDLLDQIDSLSQQAAVILLQDAAGQPGPAIEHHRDSSGSAADDTTVRVTRRLAEVLVRTSELLEPVAEAAQQWLDAKDDGDPDLLADARADLTSTLAPPSELLDLLQRLPRLVQPPSTRPTAP
jgi:hypothetical protein